MVAGDVARRHQWRRSPSCSFENSHSMRSIVIWHCLITLYGISAVVPQSSRNALPRMLYAWNKVILASCGFLAPKISTPPETYTSGENYEAHITTAWTRQYLEHVLRGPSWYLMITTTAGSSPVGLTASRMLAAQKSSVFPKTWYPILVTRYHCKLCTTLPSCGRVYLENIRSTGTHRSK